MRPQFIYQWTAQGSVAQTIWENETALGLKSHLRGFSYHLYIASSAFPENWCFQSEKNLLAGRHSCDPNPGVTVK